MSGLHRILTLVAIVLLFAVFSVSSKDSTAKNHHLMTKLGLEKRPVAPNHHRKRLASESRGSNADSHIFVVKLPPNPFYYSHFKPLNGFDSVKKLPMGFKSNGKPGKIYHWNLPMLNKMAAERRHMSRLSDGNNEVTKLKIVSSNWAKQKTGMKTSGHHGSHTRKTGGHEKPVMSFYAPALKSPVQKTHVNKYFSGNGKPHSFYVIEKSKKPVKYHRLLT